LSNDLGLGFNKFGSLCWQPYGSEWGKSNGWVWDGNKRNKNIKLCSQLLI